ncbi:MAG: ECF transporter S component [Oscillospiraceae bacterium]|nr:ECF transporter S component [Oscillospiraceae bacterium]
MSSVKKACICSVCVALCYVLPLAFHALALGGVFSPMHIPILLCGLICGWPYGAFCGVAGPVISSMLSSMPSAIQLIYMVPELCIYGLVCGLLVQLIHTGHIYIDIYCALVHAMLLGRVAGGAARAVFYTATAQSYSIALWAAAYFVESVPGIILHLLVVPALILVLIRAKLIPAYGTGKNAEQRGRPQ